jgi:hypothetical protein
VPKPDGSSWPELEGLEGATAVAGGPDGAPDGRVGFACPARNVSMLLISLSAPDLPAACRLASQSRALSARTVTRFPLGVLRVTLKGASVIAMY